jgi:nucleotide-binding universal stress UspA family protein
MWSDSLGTAKARLPGAVDHVVRFGDPVSEILAEATIVVATRTRSSGKRALLGSVAEALLRHTRIGVLMYGRHGTAEQCERMMSSAGKYPPREILVATDFSDGAEGALRVAIDYARTFHARLHVLHVFAGADIDASQLLADAAAKAGPDVPVTIAGTRGDPADEILRYARSQHIDVIAMGTHGRTGLTRAILGSVAERVVRGARCPVLVVPSVSDLARSAVPIATAAAVAVDDEVEHAASGRSCLVCARPTRDLICETCRARIRGEALERKHREERAGRG